MDDGITAAMIQALIGERKGHAYNWPMDYPVIIIGGGPGGISALLWCHSLGLPAVLLEQAAELGGQMLQMFHPVLEYPGFPNRTGRELRDAFEAHLRTYKLSYRVNCRVDEINLPLCSLVVNGERLSARAIILATGARNRRLGLAGEEELRGINYSATQNQRQYAGHEVAVVGGGDSAFEDALILGEVCPRVILIHRSDKFRARASWQKAVFNHPRIEVLPHSEITSIYQLTNDQLALTLANRATLRQENILINGLFVRLGIEPNTAFLHGQFTLDDAGYILVDQAQRSTIANVYAVGDVCRPVCFSLATAIGQGAIAAKHIATTWQREAAF